MSQPAAPANLSIRAFKQSDSKGTRLPITNVRSCQARMTIAIVRGGASENNPTMMAVTITDHVA
jgi:hypothetical protein